MRKARTVAQAVTLDQVVSGDMVPKKSIFSSFFGAKNHSKENTSKGNSMKKKIPSLILILGLLAISFFLGTKFPKRTTAQTDPRQTVPGARATVELNKEFEFPIKDSTGKEVTKLKYTIQNAELRDEIIVKGSRAVAVKGRTFLILNIKIENQFEKGITINARDYLRLSVNGNDTELTAADIHNDPVDIQPISTKVTRLGFPINDTDKKIVLNVGEIKGTKTPVPLEFK